jgi:hypothetical protein
VKSALLVHWVNLSQLKQLGWLLYLTQTAWLVRSDSSLRKQIGWLLYFMETAWLEHRSKLISAKTG